MIAVAVGLTVPVTVDGRSLLPGERAARATYGPKAASVASALAGSPVSIRCDDAAAWRSQGARYGFDPTTAWAVTPFHNDAQQAGSVPDGYSHFSPRACRYGRSFWLNPTERGARTCRIGTITKWKKRYVEKPRWLQVRSKVKGRWAQRRVRRVVRVQAQVPVNAPLYGECDSWELKLTSVHVLAHESMHLHGVTGEAEAECLAVQLDAYVAAKLGAARQFARVMARDYWRTYYAALTGEYRTPDCRDGGPLDLFPDRFGWPTPASYPADLAARISAVHGRP